MSVFLSCSPWFFVFVFGGGVGLRQGLSLNLELTNSARLDVQ